MEEKTFEECMQRMASGDREALRLVYEAYLKLIFSVCMNQLKHREAAEDVASEFFIRLFRVAGSFRGDGHHKAWLVTIAKNMCVDYMRKNGRELAVLDEPVGDDDDMQREVSPDEAGATPMFHRSDGPDLAESAANRLTLEAAMELLSEKEKEVIDLKLSAGFTFKEISEMLGMPQGTVSWHYNEAIKKLRRYMQDG